MMKMKLKIIIIISKIDIEKQFEMIFKDIY